MEQPNERESRRQKEDRSSLMRERGEGRKKIGAA